jgi:predicted O-methyltransferase YrrM
VNSKIQALVSCQYISQLLIENEIENIMQVGTVLGVSSRLYAVNISDAFEQEILEEKGYWERNQ